MPNYKLVYFNARGRAESARLIFAQANVQFEDVRLDGPDWTNYKAKTPFGQMPVLEVDGQMIAQSKAIARYLGKEFKLAPSGQYENAKLDMLVDGLDDVFNQFRAFYMEKDPEKKKEIWAKLEKENIEPFLHRYEKFLIESGSKYFVSNNITWGDLVIFDRLHTLRTRSPEVFDKFDTLVEFINRVGDSPSIKNWLEQRPKTEM